MSWHLAKSAAWAEYGRRHYRGIVFMGTFGRALPGLGVVVGVVGAVFTVRWGLHHLSLPSAPTSRPAGSDVRPDSGAHLWLPSRYAVAGVLAALLTIPGAVTLYRGFRRWEIGAGSLGALGGLTLLCGALALAAYAIVGALS